MLQIFNVAFCKVGGARGLGSRYHMTHVCHAMLQCTVYLACTSYSYIMWIDRQQAVEVCLRQTSLGSRDINLITGPLAYQHAT